MHVFCLIDAPCLYLPQALNAEERASLVGGLGDACQRGPLAGYPVAGFNLRVLEVKERRVERLLLQPPRAA